MTLAAVSPSLKVTSLYIKGFQCAGSIASRQLLEIRPMFRSIYFRLLSLGSLGAVNLISDMDSCFIGALVPLSAV